MKKLLLIAALFWSSVASAQFTPGQVLTAAELNSQFALYATLTGANFTGLLTATGITGTPISGSTGSFTNLSASGTVNGAGFTNLVAGFAPIASPTFTGVPAAPTPGNNTNSTQLATTAFLRNYLAAPTVGFGTTTPNSGAFTSLTSGSGALNGTLGGLVRNTANFTTINATGTLTGADATFTTLSSSGNDALLYQNSSAQSIPSSVATTLTGWTLFSDRVGSNFNASTGVFTAPATGVYIVSGQINFAATAEVVATTYQLLAVGNGVTVASGSSTGDAAGTYNVQVQLPGVAVALAAGQTLVLQALQNSGGARSLGANAVQTFISIYRTP